VGTSAFPGAFSFLLLVDSLSLSYDSFSIEIVDSCFIGDPSLSFLSFLVSFASLLVLLSTPFNSGYLTF